MRVVQYVAGTQLTDDGINLVTLQSDELYEIYDFMSRDTVRRKMNHYKKLLKSKRVTMSERSEPYRGVEEEKSRVTERTGRKVGKQALKTVQIAVPEEHLAYHEKLQEALDSEGRVEKAEFREGSHRGFIKNNDGEIEETNDLPNRRAKFSVTFDHEPKWPPVNRVESVRLKRREKAKNPEGIEKAFIFSDVQVPWEDAKAVEVALAVMAELKPDRVVFIGDLLDLNAWGKYEQQPQWAAATQDAINRAHKLLATVRKMLPAARIQVIEANHEARMPKALLRNAQAAYGLKRADQPGGWPAMSVPFLTAMDTLDVEWVGGYPANRIYLAPNLQVIHGTTAGANNAKRTSAAQKTSTIYGHDHRLGMSGETINTYDGGEQIYSYGTGCLCRIDGHVPSVKMGREVDGTPIHNLENWSQGFIIASYMPDGGPFYVEQVAINTLHDYQTMFRGKVYEPNK